MATEEELLQRFMPKVCYDSLEAFFADHPLQVLVNPGNRLRRGPNDGRDSALLAAAAKIELDWPKYLDAKEGAESDRLDNKGRDYRMQYGALRKAHPDLKSEPPRTFTFNVEGRRSGSIEMSIVLVPRVEYEARIAVATKDGRPSAPLILSVLQRRTLRTTILTRVAKVVRPTQEWVIRIFKRSRGEGP